jgi:hypothetical protein
MFAIIWGTCALLIPNEAMAIWKWLAKDREARVWETIERIFALIELLSFAFLLTIGFVLITKDIHRYVQAREFFMAACICLVVGIIAIIYNYVKGVLRWVLIVLLCAFSLCGLVYLMGIADDAQHEYEAGIVEIGNFDMKQRIAAFRSKATQPPTAPAKPAVIQVHRKHTNAANGEPYLEPIQVSVDCEAKPLPLLIPPGSEIKFEYLTKATDHTGHLYSATNPGSRFAKQWPSPKQFPSAALKCIAKAHGTVDVLDFRAIFKSRWGVVDPNNVQAFWARPEPQLDVYIDVLDVGQPYTFYLVNLCPELLNMWIPIEGNARLAGEDNANYRKFDLIGRDIRGYVLGPNDPDSSDGGNGDCKWKN